MFGGEELSAKVAWPSAAPASRTSPMNGKGTTPRHAMRTVLTHERLEKRWGTDRVGLAMAGESRYHSFMQGAPHPGGRVHG